MGFNTTVIVLNDGLGDIADDPKFGRNLVKACLRVTQEFPCVVPAGRHGNPCTVVGTHHADDVTLVAVGGNYATNLVQVYSPYCRHDMQTGQEELLRALADKLGYTVRKKAS